MITWVRSESPSWWSVIRRRSHTCKQCHFGSVVRRQDTHLALTLQSPSSSVVIKKVLAKLIAISSIARRLSQEVVECERSFRWWCWCEVSNQAFIHYIPTTIHKLFVPCKHIARYCISSLNWAVILLSIVTGFTPSVVINLMVCCAIDDSSFQSNIVIQC